ncbi:hypothetical protein FQA39_LY00646 [Lamprigera yunnana]|nr:hypothetical protein FQA39_LY00646 [Lamprigera yunnana]
MSESKGSLLAKSVQKHAGRAKEKILQNLGKVDRTADDIFDEHLQNFTRQQNAANKLQKEFSNYIRCVRAIQTASKSLLESIGEIYESQWSGHDLLFMHTQSVDVMWQDFNHKLGDEVLIPLNTYQGQFLEMRKKIDKRGRKLVDYDSQRHNFQALQLGMTKKRDDVKLNKGREQLDEAKRTYDMLNSELHDELPALYDSRILFLVTNLQSLFSAEQVFHSENAKVFAELEAIVDKLATESQRGSYSIKKSNGSTLTRTTSNNSPPVINNVSPPIASIPLKPAEDIASATTKIENDNDQSISSWSQDSDVPLKIDPQSNSPTKTTPEVPINTPPVSKTESNTLDGCNNPIIISKSSDVKAHVDNNKVTNKNVETTHKSTEELYDIPVGATTDNLPSGVLYRVKATYKYNREDADELSFDVDEIIQVIEYDDPEEQEEGWLMGMKETSGEKGMFPANFTKPL